MSIFHARPAARWRPFCTSFGRFKRTRCHVDLKQQEGPKIPGESAVAVTSRRERTIHRNVVVEKAASLLSKVRSPTVDEKEAPACVNRTRGTFCAGKVSKHHVSTKLVSRLAETACVASAFLQAAHAHRSRFRAGLTSWLLGTAAKVPGKARNTYKP